MGISEDRIYLISEVADSLGFRSKTLRKLIRSNALGGAFKVGKQWRISELMFKRRLWGEEKVPIPIITDKLLPLTVVSQFLHVEEDLRDLISASEIPLKFTEAGSQLECLKGAAWVRMEQSTRRLRLMPEVSQGTSFYYEKSRSA